MERTQLMKLGLKFDPFDAPVEGLHLRTEVEHFIRRVEMLCQHGGFALITGDPGVGKSAVMRLLHRHLSNVRDLKVATLSRPQCQHADFYREMGELFGVQLSPHNRWAGTKVLRGRWLEHMHSVLFRPVLLIDEAQEMFPAVLNELRLMMSTELDSRVLLTVVLCGDGRLLDKLRTAQLLPVHSRIRVRLALDAATPELLQEHLRHTLENAGQQRLLSPDVQQTLSEHAAGNLRVMMTMGTELLEAAVHKNLQHIDEKLYLEVFAPPVSERPTRKAPSRRS